MEYSYRGYEDAYCHGRFLDCKTIGIKLLKKKTDKRSEKLLKKLSHVNINYNAPEEDKKNLAKVLLEVKVWLMVNQ